MINEKLYKIYDYTHGKKDKWVKVLLKDGREITCQADCFGWEETEDGGDDILSLVVDGKRISEILIDDDIESVTEID